MIVVTHEIGFARDVGDRGRLHGRRRDRRGGPRQQVIEQPKEERTKRFLGLVLEH